MKKRSRGKTKLETRLSGSQTPIFLLDRRRRIVFFNQGCEQLTGWESNEAIGQVCDYASEPDASNIESMTTCLCPPPEVWDGHELNVPTYFVQRDGRSIARLVQFMPLIDETQRVEHVLGVVTVIQQATKPIAASPAKQLHAELAALRISLRQQYSIKSLVFRSRFMQRVVDQIDVARKSNVFVSLRGDAGVGKEHVARVIHYESAGGIRSFVPLDCRGLSALQLKQALHRLLDADAADSSILALQPGTLYLDDVEFLSRDLQARLLAAFQPGEVGRRLELRLMSSSQIELRAAVADERLLENFYLMLTPLQIELSRLRDRADDLEPLAQYFLEQANRGDEKQVGGLSEEVWPQFRTYNWPGNLNELQSVVEEARASCQEDFVATDDLPFRFRTGQEAQAVGPMAQSRIEHLEPLLARVEKEQIEIALRECRQNKTQAAKRLGCTRARLYRRMQALGIDDLE
jgi:PAS domain S-box-containing protein